MKGTNNENLPVDAFDTRASGRHRSADLTSAGWSTNLHHDLFRQRPKSFLHNDVLLKCGTSQLELYAIGGSNAPIKMEIFTAAIIMIGMM